MGQLSSVLVESYSDIYIRDTISRSVLKRVERFRDEDYVDLRHFVRLLGEGYSGKNKAVREKASQLCDHLKVEREQGPILANVAGFGHKNAHGLSVYFPLRGCSRYYTPDHLAFADSPWRHLIHTVNEVSLPEE